MTEGRDTVEQPAEGADLSLGHGHAHGAAGPFTIHAQAPHEATGLEPRGDAVDGAELTGQRLRRDRSDSSIDVTFGHRWRNSGMNVRLGAAIRHPDGKSSTDK